MVVNFAPLGHSWTSIRPKRLAPAAVLHLGRYGAASCPSIRRLLYTSASAKSPATEQA
ncbi:hypothetical protein FRC11_008909, partial [Ceratobasidium sp. 423]